VAHRLRHGRPRRRPAVDDEFETELRAHSSRYRMAGYDLEVDGPRFVPLDVALTLRASRSTSART
jgi:hypothetical protein